MTIETEKKMKRYRTVEAKLSSIYEGNMNIIL